MATLGSLAAAMAILAAPAADQAVAQLVLRWQAVTGAVAYELQIAPEPSFTAPVISTRVEVPGYRWSEIPTSRHHWRVRSVDADGRTGPWSAVKPIESALTAPEPVSPADGARITWGEEPTTPDFAGTPSEILRAYTVEVSRHPDFGRVEVSRTAASPTVRLPLPGPGVFWWRMRGTTLSGRETEPSSARRLEVLVGPPLPVAPGPSEVVPFGPIALRWQAWTWVTRWKVSVERLGADAGEPAWQSEVVAGEALFLPRRPGTYRWSVAAVAANGVAGPPSRPRAVQVTAAPRPLAPGAGELVGEDDPSAQVVRPPSAGLPALASRWRLGLLAGWQTNLESVSAPSLSLEVLWRTRWLSDRVLLAARVGIWSTSARVPVQPGLPTMLEATARVDPLSLLALLEWPLGLAVAYGGAGVGINLVRVTSGPDSSLAATPSATLLVGASVPLGRGELFAEADGSIGHLDTSLGQLRTGGLFVGLGYRYRP